MSDERGYESIKTKPFDPLTMIFDEWFYGDFHHLVGARNPKIYYLLRSGAGLLENLPTAADPDNPTNAETEAIKVHLRHQLELYSLLMMCLPRHLQHVANQGQGEDPHGREACERLVRHYHEDDPGYLPDLSYSVHNLSMKECDNHAERFLYVLDHKCSMLAARPEYAVPVQARITILIRALKADSRFDHIIQEHTVNPYAGELGYEKLKQTVVSFARRFQVQEQTLDPSDTPHREQALNLRGIQRQGKSRRCFNCGDPNHFVRECPKPLKPELRRPRAPRPTSI